MSPVAWIECFGSCSHLSVADIAFRMGRCDSYDGIHATCIGSLPFAVAQDAAKGFESLWCRGTEGYRQVKWRDGKMHFASFGEVPLW